MFAIINMLVSIRPARTDFTDYLIVHRLSLLNGFTFVSVFFRFLIFLNRFPLQLFLVPYSYVLLCTPLLVCFLVSSSSFFSVFTFS